MQGVPSSGDMGRLRGEGTVRSRGTASHTVMEQCCFEGGGRSVIPGGGMTTRGTHHQPPSYPQLHTHSSTLSPVLHCTPDKTKQAPAALCLAPGVLLRLLVHYFWFQVVIIDSMCIINNSGCSIFCSRSQLLAPCHLQPHRVDSRYTGVDSVCASLQRIILLSDVPWWHRSGRAARKSHHT